MLKILIEGDYAPRARVQQLLEHRIIQDTKELKKQVDEYYRSTAVGMLIMHQPYENRILNKLYRMHLLPSLVSKKRFLLLLNYIDCESHHDKHVFTLKQLFDK